jgi:hypothetical protein
MGSIAANSNSEKYIGNCPAVSQVENSVSAIDLTDPIAFFPLSEARKTELARVKFMRSAA